MFAARSTGSTDSRASQPKKFFENVTRRDIVFGAGLVPRSIRRWTSQSASIWREIARSGVSRPRYSVSRRKSERKQVTVYTE